jgi:hypothetical protein
VNALRTELGIKPGTPLQNGLPRAAVLARVRCYISASPHQPESVLRDNCEAGLSGSAAG